MMIFYKYYMVLVFMLIVEKLSVSLVNRVVKKCCGFIDHGVISRYTRSYYRRRSPLRRGKFIRFIRTRHEKNSWKRNFNDFSRSDDIFKSCTKNRSTNA